VTEDPQAFVALIKGLEIAVGNKSAYPILEPFPCQVFRNGQLDLIAIQQAGKKIAHHSGLADLMFIVGVTAQEPNTAGHIELKYGSREVFIEISQDICRYKDAVLATLSHEIAHKFLHTHQLKNGNTQLEQEFLTDVTAVYLGMGKIMLNGCECTSSSWVSSGGRTKSTTHTLRTGYISRPCFAFVYRVICEMRQVSKREMLQGLSPEALEAIESCERDYRDWLDLATAGERKETLYDEIEELQGRIAENERLLRNAQQNLALLTDAIRELHVPLAKARTRIGEEPSVSSRQMRFLQMVESSQTVRNIVRTSVEKFGRIEADWDSIEALGAAEVNSQYEVIQCPIDGRNLRVPGGRSLLVTCPACKYKFIVKTGKSIRSSWTDRLKARVRNPFSTTV
jgi:hypothetical protein